MLLSLSATVCAQPSIPNDTCSCEGICYTDRQDINCLRCLGEERLKDKEIEKLDSAFNACAEDFDLCQQSRKDLKTVIRNDSILMVTKDSVILSKTNQLEKSIRQKKFFAVGGGASTVAAIIASIVAILRRN